jgi:hypothetical protein
VLIRSRLSALLPARNDFSTAFTQINVVKANVACYPISTWDNKQFAFSSYTHREIIEIVGCQVQCEEKVSGSLKCVLGVGTDREETLIYTNICQPKRISKSDLICANILSLLSLITSVVTILND